MVVREVRHSGGRKWRRYFGVTICKAAEQFVEDCCFETNELVTEDTLWKLDVRDRDMPDTVWNLTVRRQTESKVINARGGV